VAERIRSIIKYNKLIGKRTRDLPACSTLPQVMNECEFISLGICNGRRNDDDDPHITETMTAEVGCVTRQYISKEMCSPFVTKQFISIYYTSLTGPCTMCELHGGFVISGCELCISFRGRTVPLSCTGHTFNFTYKSSHVMAHIHQSSCSAPPGGSRPDESFDNVALFKYLRTIVKR
jgi:hypothetical protein